MLTRILVLSSLLLTLAGIALAQAPGPYQVSSGQAAVMWYSISRRWTTLMRSALPTILILPLLALPLLSACDQRPADPALPVIDVEWRTLRSLDLDFSATSVWAAFADDIYVGRPSSESYGDVIAGGTPDVLHFDGVSWTTVPLPIADENGRTSIWGSGSDDVYIAVENLYHYDGSTWQRQPVEAELVTGTSTSDVFAAGRSAIFHFDGAEWDTLLTLDRTFVRAISATPTGELYASLYDKILFWDRTTWTQIPWVDPYNDALAIVGFSATNAVALSRYPDQMYRWDGGQWQPEPSVPGGLNAIWGGSASDMFAVGGDGLVLHYDGVGWQTLPRPTGFPLTTVAGVGGSGAVAAGMSSKVVAFDGTSWRTLREGTVWQPNVLWAESPTQLMVGQGTIAYKLDGAGWSEVLLPDNTGVSALGGRALDDLYGAFYARSSGRPSVYHYDGQSWTMSADSLEQYAFWVAPSGTLYSAGAGSIYRFGGVWEKQVEGDFRLDSMDGEGEGDIVAAGGQSDQRGVVMRYDGTSWRELPGLPEYASGVCVSPDHSVYVSTWRNLYRWNGGGFVRLTPPRSGSFNDVFYISDGRVVALGGNVTAVFDGDLVNLIEEGNPYWVVQTLDGSLVGLTQRALMTWKP